MISEAGPVRNGPMPDRRQVDSAYRAVVERLMSERNSMGHWVGRLSSSALSTATAISFLAFFRESTRADQSTRQQIDMQIEAGLNWLGAQQNSDGGWGDTPQNYSNISTSMLVVAAMHAAGAVRKTETASRAIQMAEQYIESAGGVEGIRRRYGDDKTFAVPILANAAMAGLVDWREVPVLPFEAACVPQRFYHLLRLPVVSYAVPALVAIGQAKFFFDPPGNPLMRTIRRRCRRRSLAVLERMQPASGGFLEAVPLTSFVGMSLVKIGHANHPVALNALKFVLDSYRNEDAVGGARAGSWPIDTNLAMWTTNLSVAALTERSIEAVDWTEGRMVGCRRWILDGQYQEVHPFTGAAPGGWGWTDLSGAVPDADDTPAALIALRRMVDSGSLNSAERQEIEAAAAAGIRWLVQLQNRDGGWPTFCRGWGRLPFDRSGADITAHVIRALWAWREIWDGAASVRRITKALNRGFRFLERKQESDGRWLPLWFGNQDFPDDENPCYGTAKVLMAYRDTGRIDTKAGLDGLRWLINHQNADGGWGGGPSIRWPDAAGLGHSSVEETALCTEILADATLDGASRARAGGVGWLVRCIEAGCVDRASPIGFYFAKLWYYERLYPLIFATAALGRTLRTFETENES